MSSFPCFMFSLIAISTFTKKVDPIANWWTSELSALVAADKGHGKMFLTHTVLATGSAFIDPH